MDMKWKTWKVAAGAALLTGTAAAVAAVAHAATSNDPAAVQAALADRLPKTEITAIDCEKIDGVCEVQAKQNLFYIDHGARYLIIGRVYDMETKQDLTAARLLEMNPDMLVGGGGAADGPGTPTTARSTELRQRSRRRPLGGTVRGRRRLRRPRRGRRDRCAGQRGGRDRWA